MKYNYLENLKEDIKTYIKENDLLNDEQVNYDALYDDMFIEDSITGNASGSYYCNTWKAEEAICHNMDLLKEALTEFGYTIGNEYHHLGSRGAEWCDVTIRCYLLGQALHEVIEEMEEQNNEN